MAQDTLMTYSYSAVERCVKATKEFWNDAKKMKRKIEHTYYLNKLYDLYEFCFNETGCYLFNLDWMGTTFALKEYTDAIRDGKSKKVLDQKLRFVLIQDFHDLLTSIRRDMDCGEVHWTL